MKKFIITLFPLLLCFSTFASSDANTRFSLEANITKFEQTDSPFKLVRNIGEQVFSAVKLAKQDEQEFVQANMQLIVEQLLMPYVDVPFASYKVLGTNLKSSTKEERQLFIQAMAKNLIQTYSTALAQYNDQSITYESDKDTKNSNLVAVKTELVSAERPPIDITFKMRKNKRSGEWKAYDLVVEGISLIDSKRAELAKPLRVNGVRYVAEKLLN